MTARWAIRVLAATLWLGGALLATGAAVEGLDRLLTQNAPPPPARLSAGLELTRSCAARLPAGDELVLWSATGPAEPESFGFLWMLASYREYPRPVAPLFPLATIHGLEQQRLLDRNLATLLRDKLAAMPTQSVRGFIAWSDQPGDGARCESSAFGAGVFEAVETNDFGTCCMLRTDSP